MTNWLRDVDHRTVYGDPGPKRTVVSAFSESAALGADAFWAVNCQDDQPPSYRRVVADTDRFRRAYPLTGASWNVFPCSFWPSRPHRFPVDGHDLPELLMINNDADPATPLANARAARRATPRAVLVTVENQSDHAVYARGDACVETVANNWLLAGKLPKQDITCAGLPLPEPGQTEAASRARGTAVAGFRPTPATAIHG
jgi:hypothetical protein